MNIKRLIFGVPAEPAQAAAQYKASSQAWLPITDVRDGVVITKDGRYLKILEVLPVNFYLKSPIEQQNIIYFFASYLKVAPDTLQIYVCTQRADMEGYTRRMRERLEEETEESCRELILDNISEVEYLASSHAVTRRYFLIIPFESGMRVRANTFRAIAERLSEEEQTARRYLDMCGLEVLVPDYSDNFQLELLYMLINKSTSQHQKLPAGVYDMVSMVQGVDDGQLPCAGLQEEEKAKTEKKKRRRIRREKKPLSQGTENEAIPSDGGSGYEEGLSDNPHEAAEPEAAPVPAAPVKKWRRRKRHEQPEVNALDSGAFTVPDILALSSADRAQSGYIRVDGVYHAYLYITGYGYFTIAGNGWLVPLTEAGDGVNVSFYLERQAKDRILKKIAQTTMVHRSRMRDVGDTRPDYEELDSAIASGLFLKENINRNNEDFYYMHTLIEVTADDPDTLEQRVSGVLTLCTSMDMVARRCDYRHEQAFLSMLPLAKLDPDLERKSRRNVLTSSAAASFPFSSYELCDRSGVLLGLNLHNRSMCMLDFFDSKKYSNSHTTLLGMSGAGKTFLLQLLASRFRQQGIQVMIVCPAKGYEFRPLCEAIGGTYIKLSPSSDDCINIFDIHRHTLDTDAETGQLAERNDSLLADKIARLHIYYSLLIPDMTPLQRNRLDAALVEVYRRRGIGYDNASLYEADGVTRKPMPTRKDMYDILSANPDTQDLALVESRFVTGSARRLGQATNVNLDNPYVVIDTSEVGKDLIAAATFTATDFCTEKCKESRIRKKVLILDELWTLIGASANQQAADFVLGCYKTYRGYGATVIGATQDLNDFFALEGGKYGRAILNNSRIKVVLPLEEEEAVRVKEVLGLSDEEMLQVIRNKRGEGLLCIGHNRISVAFQSTQKEYDMITTSRADLEEQMRRGRS